MEIETKNSEVLRDLLSGWDSTLVDVVEWIYDRYRRVLITCEKRKKRHDNDLHGVKPLRAVDLRSWIYTEPEALAKDINNKWAYDPKRPMMDVCVFHDSGEGEHFHIQVHPNTKRKI